ncbi:hypothetical protein CBR_g22162 [Chara braunii]|uniref:Reverse transcriptase domain-containing protein n=1 Tax=Chara braunii TaxID=69332 RepID=A0A388L264_CHABU|nr:hypothetical protein CBR_g22162 [Chara braunii]|eukprot:GBG76414.1 hypothetical protein CBR_g22162 [Chara braunii]
MDVGSLKDGVQLQQTATQQLEQRICTTANTSSSEPRETTQKFDGQEIFCDSMKTYQIPWFCKFELTLQLHNVKEHKHHAYLYSRSGGACQAWLDNLLSKYGVVAADLHTKISWDDLKAAWHKRFQVEPPEIKAMDKLMVFEQGTLSSTDWIAEYQRLTSVPDIQMGFKAIRQYFISRSCPTLSNALTHVEDTLTTTAEIFDKTAQIIITNKEAKNLRSSASGPSRDQHRPRVAMVAAATPFDQTSEAVSANEGDRLAAAREGYHQISIRPNDRYKSTFKTQYAHFEWVVMPFGLTNAPTTFQAAMTNEFRAMLDRFVLVYLDDILVYSLSLEDHLGHLRRELETLRRAKYKANRDKCEFVRQELEYLGHFVTPEGISPLSDKIQAIQEWSEPRNVTDFGKHLGPVEDVAASTLVEAGDVPSPVQELAKATDSLVTPQTHPGPTILCTLDVSEALEDLQGEWSAKDPCESWVALSRGPRGVHFVVEVGVGGRKCGAFVDIGSTRNFISRDCVDRLCLKDRVQRLSRSVASTLANKERMMVEDYVKNVVCTFSYPGGEINHKISFLVSNELPFDMLLGMYYLEVAKPEFDWDKKVLKHELPNERTVRLAKYKASRLIDSYGCLWASAFYNYYKQNQEEGICLVYVSAKGEVVKTPPEIDTIVSKYPDLFEEPSGVVDREAVHAIEIIPGSKTPKGRIYRMAPTELDELRRQLKELTEKGWIRPNTSPFGSPVLFVPKKGGTLRMCIDYGGLNAVTVKNAEPLPRIDDLLDRVQGCKYYTKIDSKSDYHEIAIRPQDRHRTAFHTRYGLYDFVVMPLGLCNAPGTFQHAMNRIFHDFLDKFVVVYLDDILIISKTIKEHAQRVDKVLSLLQQHKYKINAEKCKFGRTQILYLGHEDGIRPEDAKVASIRDWPRPQSVTEVRSFLGMCGYYRNFVKNYSTIASPLTDLTRLDTPWDWTDECEAAFKRLKHALTHHEVFMVPDPQRPFVVTIDASRYGIGAVLAQQEGKKLRPVEYMSRRMLSKKLAKSTYDRELYAFYKALVHWRHYLLGRFFYLRTDHQTLKWIKTQAVLSNALKRWIEVIDQYDFKLNYVKGEYNKVADAFSRRAVYLGALIYEFGLSEDVTRSMEEAYKEDPITMGIINKLQAKDKATTDEFVMVDGLLFLEKAGFKRLVFPSKEDLRSLFLGECHDATGHFGYKKTSANLVQ